MIGSYIEAQSLYNDDAIYIALHNSNNPKIGTAKQISFIPRNMFTDSGFNKASDAAVCPSSCVFRDSGACYVILGLAVNAIVKSIKSGKYAKGLNFKLLRDSFLRVGAYGDCTAVEFEVIESIVKKAGKGFANYTHAWRECDSRFNNIAMASVESIDDAKAAQSLGYRTFRVMLPGDNQLMDGEILCPNEYKKSITCARCNLCDGIYSGKRKPNVAIHAHGTVGKVNKITKLLGA